MDAADRHMKPTGSVNVEVIATGDELIFGRILDTNSNWIAKRVAEMGARLRRVTMIGDADVARQDAGRNGREDFVPTSGVQVFDVGFPVDGSAARQVGVGPQPFAAASAINQ